MIGSFPLRRDAPSAAEFDEVLLFDDGRIVFQPRDSRQPVVTVHGIKPPLRRTALCAYEGDRSVRDAAALGAFLLWTSAVFIFIARWLASRS